MPQCLFCSIVSRTVPADVILENEAVLAFKDINPQAPQHILIIPKKHISGVLDFTKKDGDILTALMDAAQAIAKKFLLDKAGFRLVLNSGRDAGQAVDHVHMHLLGGRKLTWPPG